MSTSRRQRAGFTLTEMAIVGVLMGFLAVCLGRAWDGLAQPSIDLMVRCMVQQEAQIAAMSLSEDCGGCPPGKISDIQGLKISDICTGVSTSDDDLVISFSNETVTYRLNSDNHTLVRDHTVDMTTTSVVIASNVYGMSLNNASEPGDLQTGWIKVNLTFRLRGEGRSQYTTPYKYVFYVPESIP